MSIASTPGGVAPSEWRPTYQGAGVGLTVGLGIGALAARQAVKTSPGAGTVGYYLFAGAALGMFVGSGAGGLLDTRGGSTGAVAGGMLGAAGLALSAGSDFRGLPGTGPAKVAAGVAMSGAAVLAFAGIGALMGTALELDGRR